ncbi:hypothetical protein CIK69_01580 [Brachybacterium alimentarium]|uniref:hypothetical protein n=1 Tax=Brachybacterium alimentarium TaxID=47845 RepID=UPI000DF402A1|nr:hypothetical protein [Brachybacterium alimentarium]RCS93543.1 hypothetical protein CIK69_01580 [Brachybacterium alimentarium]
MNDLPISLPVLIGIIVVVLVLLVILIVVGAQSSKRRKAQQQEEDRRRADELRQEAQAKDRAVQERDLTAKESELEADRARLDADKKAKAAEQEQVAAERRRQEADQQRASVEQERGSVDDQLAEADRLDPDTPEDARGDHRDASRTRAAGASPDAAASQQDGGRPAETRPENQRGADARRDDVTREDAVRPSDEHLDTAHPDHGSLEAGSPTGRHARSERDEDRGGSAQPADTTRSAESGPEQRASGQPLDDSTIEKRVRPEPAHRESDGVTASDTSELQPGTEGRRVEDRGRSQDQAADRPHDEDRDLDDAAQQTDASGAAGPASAVPAPAAGSDQEAARFGEQPQAEQPLTDENGDPVTEAPEFGVPEDGGQQRS